MEEAEAEDWVDILEDFPTFCSLLNIETKARGQATVPFHYEDWHPEQVEFERDRTGKDVVLKSRQIGFSTLELARDLWTPIRFPGTNVLIACHQDGDNRLAKKLLRTLKLMAESLAVTPLLPRAEYDNVREWTFPDIRSSITVEIIGKSERTAGEKGRGVTIHRAHLTEVAKWGPGEMEAWNAIDGSLVDDAEVVFESTAGGAGNLFHKMVEGAQEGTNGYKLHFWPWFKHPQYQAKPTPSQPGARPSTDLQRRLVEVYGVTRDQLTWWQRKVGTRPGGERLALQEYPPDIHSAFLVSGDTFFDPEALMRLKGTQRGLMRKKPTLSLLLRREESKAKLVIYKEPKEGVRYVLGADTSEGVGGDESAGVVWDENGDYCARIAGQYPPGFFGQLLGELGRWYNRAMVVPERNNHGHTVLLQLEHDRYPNVFPPKWMGPKTQKRRMPWHDGKGGWYTNPKTRPLMLDAFEEAFREGLLGDLPDQRLISQMKTFIVGHDGIPRAAGKQRTGKWSNLDDIVIAAAIGWFVRSVALPPRQIKSRSSKARDALGIR